MCQQLVSQALGESITSQQRLQRKLAGKAMEAAGRQRTGKDRENSNDGLKHEQVLPDTSLVALHALSSERHEE